MVNDADTFKGTNTSILESKKKKKQPIFSEIVAIQLKNGLYTALTAIKDHWPRIKNPEISRTSPPDSPSIRKENRHTRNSNQIWQRWPDNASGMTESRWMEWLDSHRT